MDALMGVVKASVASQAFHQRNPSVDTCYDHVAGYDPATALPCKAAFIVKNNCVRCHSAPESGTPSDGLYLDKWITLQDGSTTFLHIAGGKQVDPETTFTDITAHLTASDPKIRMPKGAFMENQDRLDLFTWADAMAQKYAKPIAPKSQARSQR
jgi:cytochrome c5